MSYTCGNAVMGLPRVKYLVKSDFKAFPQNKADGLPRKKHSVQEPFMNLLILSSLYECCGFQYTREAKVIISLVPFQVPR